MPAGIFVTDKLSGEAREELRDHDVFEETAGDAILARCQVLMAWPSRLKTDLVQRMPNLRMVQSMAAGVDGVTLSALPSQVKAYSTAGAFTGAVAEHAWGILLGVAKGLHDRERRVTPRRLGGKYLLALGCGSIGSEIARLSRSISMRTIGVSRSFRHPEYFDDTRPIEGLEDVVPRADAIAIALPLTLATRRLVDYELLMRTKEDVTIVNVGRGDTVDEDGLIRWLKMRPESRYETDVFWKTDGKETFETEAWDLPNFAGTRHVSGVPRDETLAGAKLEAARNVRRFLETGEAPNLVDTGEYL